MLLILLILLLSVLVFLQIYSKLSAGECNSNVCLIGKTCLITGGVTGLGFETALKLAARGCKVIIADIVNGENSVRRIIEESNNPNVSFKYLDIGDFKSVRRFSKEFLEQEERLDILINNAGISNCDGVVNPDGTLKIMAVNYYGHFLLTHLLISLIRKTENSRVIFTSSILAFLHGIKNPKHLNEMQKTENRYIRNIQQYGNTKVCMLITSNLLSMKGIHANSVYPGMVNTQMNWHTVDFFRQAILTSYFLSANILLFSKSANKGAETLLDAAISKKLNGNSGLFLSDCKPFAQPSVLKDLEFCRMIWEETERIVGLQEDEKIK